jgi:hypothetical protein
MAAIDTIEVLDNLQFEHLDTADIFTIHADGMAGESVVTFPCLFPESVLAARVIINNNYAASPMIVAARVKLTAVSGRTTTTVPKIQNVQPLEWTSIAAGSYAETAEIDLTNLSEPLLHVDVAVIAAGTHTGTEIIVQVRKEATVEEWTGWCRPAVLVGSVVFKADVLSTAAAGQKVIAVNNPTAGNLNHVCKQLFILDATIANSEVVFQTACGADA